MNPSDVLHHGKHAANKGRRSLRQTCDQTKLTTLAVVDVFPSYSELLVESRQF